MKSFKVDKSLSEIVCTIRNAGFKPEYQVIDDDKKIWMMYSQKNEILNLTYVNDHREIFSIETFRNLGGKEEEETIVRGILKQYRTLENEISNASKINLTNLLTFTGIGATGTLFLSKNIGVAGIGGALGLILYETIRRDILSDAKHELNTYIKERGMHIGNEAIKKMKK